MLRCRAAAKLGGVTNGVGVQDAARHTTSEHEPNKMNLGVVQGVCACGSAGGERGGGGVESGGGVGREWLGMGQGTARCADCSTRPCYKVGVPCGGSKEVAVFREIEAPQGSAPTGSHQWAG